MSVSDCGRLTVFKLLAPLKAFAWIVVTPSGMWMLSRLVQFWNRVATILVAPSAKETFFSPVVPRNTPPTPFTRRSLAGITMLTSIGQSLKA